jgi:hypothetical protein
MDTVVLFSSRYGFWCSIKGWVDTLNDAELYHPKTNIVAGFKNRIDVDIVNTQECTEHTHIDFLNICLDFIDTPEHSELNKKVLEASECHSSLNAQSKLLDTCLVHVTEAMGVKFFKAGRKITTFPKNAAKKAEKVPLVSPYLAKTPRSTKRKTRAA